MTLTFICSNVLYLLHRATIEEIITFARTLRGKKVLNMFCLFNLGHLHEKIKGLRGPPRVVHSSGPN